MSAVGIRFWQGILTGGGAACGEEQWGLLKVLAYTWHLRLKSHLVGTGQKLLLRCLHSCLAGRVLVGVRALEGRSPHSGLWILVGQGPEPLAVPAQCRVAYRGFLKFISITGGPPSGAAAVFEGEAGFVSHSFIHQY